MKLENSLMVGGLLYSILTVLIFSIFGMEPSARFIFNVFIGITGSLTGVSLKARSLLQDKRSTKRISS
jgi:hypothetical protein